MRTKISAKILLLKTKHAWENKDVWPDFTLVLSIEKMLSAHPLCHDKLQGRLSSWSWQTAQKLQQRFQLGVNQVGKYHDERLWGDEKGDWSGNKTTATNIQVHLGKKLNSYSEFYTQMDILSVSLPVNFDSSGSQFMKTWDSFWGFSPQKPQTLHRNYKKRISNRKILHHDWHNKQMFNKEQSEAA